MKTEACGAVLVLGFIGLRSDGKTDTISLKCRKVLFSDEELIFHWFAAQDSLAVEPSGHGGGFAPDERAVTKPRAMRESGENVNSGLKWGQA